MIFHDHAVLVQACISNDLFTIFGMPPAGEAAPKTVKMRGVAVYDASPVR